jgi:magnesium chelatase family protein
MEKLATIFSSVNVGLEPCRVEVEVDVGAGIPSLTIVGLPDKAVEESKERVRLALKNSGFDFPQKKIVVNLAPADIKKEGPCYDLPIAIGVLVAGGLIDPEKIKNTVFLGELSLGGGVRPTKGVVQAEILDKK